MLSKYKLNQLYFKDTQFANLMTRRIFNVLLIANPYDAFMLEDDGRIDEKIFNEYTSLSLRYPPRFSQVSTEEEALTQLENMSFDLVICMPSTGDNDSFDIGRHIKEKYEHIPIVILTPFSHGITKRIINEDLSAFEYVFCWLGNTDLLVSIIKLMEDKMNLEHDVQEVGVQMILLVEDGIRFYSSILPNLYKFVLKQSQEFSTEALNAHQRTLRMRGRPKIVLARTYQEAMEIYRKYQNNILGVITDVRFPKVERGEKDGLAGIKLCAEIRKNDPFVPLIIQSSESENSSYAAKYGASFIDKNSKKMDVDLRRIVSDNFGFGDFIFRNPDTGEEIARVRNLKELQNILFAVPAESFLYHISRNHVSRWFYSRAMFPVAEFLKPITTGASISVNGILTQSQGKGQNVEIQATEIEIFGTADPATYPLQKKGHSMEFLREIAHLRPRTNTFGAVFRIRHNMAYAIHKFFHDRGFFYFHTPIITASDCEGAGQMFQVTTKNLYDLKKDENGSIIYEDDFFGKQASLTVSGQLEGELAATALGQIYTFGPTFRAENSNTPRHLAEFWMIEPEVAFNDITDNMELAEEFIKYCVQWALDNCMEDIKFLNDMFDKELIARLEGVLKDSFVRLPYTEGIKILEEAVAKGHKFEFPVYWGVDLASEHERFLVEDHFKRPVILTDYPKEIKAFYMKQNEDGKTVRAMDVLFPKIGEIIGGSEREADYDKLMTRIDELGIPMKDMWWYLDTRRFGTVPHSGFGLGFERLLLFVTGMGNIRDVIPFPRTPNNAEF